VVTAEQEVAIAVEEAHVPGRVPRGVQWHQVPAGQVQATAVLEEHVRLRLGHPFANPHRRLAQLGDHLRGHTARGEQAAHLRHHGVDAGAVPPRQQRRVGGVERDPRPAGLAQPAGEAVVVGVDVGDQRGADVGDPIAGQGEAVDQRRPGVVGVPAGVHHGDAVVQLEEMDEHVAKRVVGYGHGHRPEPGSHPLHLGEHAVAPGLALRGSGDFDGTHEETS
jgi:hypothetical protein